MPTKPKAEGAAAEPIGKNETPMTEMLRKILLASLGAVVIAQEEIEAFINRLVERGEIAEKDGKKLVHEMMDKRKSKTKEVEEEVNKNIKDALDRMNIPTKSDIDSLGQKITALSKKIDDLKKTA